MSKSESLSVWEKLLIAASHIEAKGRRSFSAEDLVVKAWEDFPDTFGLAGHFDDNGVRIYPDSNRVFAEIMGSKPLRKKGFLAKAGNKIYRLTEAGRQKAEILETQQNGSDRVEKVGLGREALAELRRLFSTKAISKYNEGRADEITFADACSFWNISARSTAMEYEARINNFIAIAQRAEEMIAEKKVSFDHGGASFGKDEVGALMLIHQTLQEKFNREIEYIQKRRDERVQ